MAVLMVVVKVVVLMYWCEWCVSKQVDAECPGMVCFMVEGDIFRLGGGFCGGWCGI